MTKLEHALALAARGFWVFPIVAGKKAPPALKDWQGAATRDPETIYGYWQIDPEHNIGISTSKFGDSEALLVVDADNKGKKHGSQELLRLELDGFSLPETYTARTATGGWHYFHRVPAPVRQGANVLGPGLDVRSRGGYVVGVGSTVAAGSYECASDGPVAAAPAWLVDACGVGKERSADVSPERPGLTVDAEQARNRATYYLRNEAPTLDDPDAYKVACRVKDFGVDLPTCIQLMQEHWDPRCEPPRSDDTVTTARNAYTYGLDSPGISAPEAVFDVVPVQPPAPSTEHGQHPFDKLNAEYAFVIAGGTSHILWETTDQYGTYSLRHLGVQDFKLKHAALRMNTGKRDEPITDLWLQSPRRRSFDGICFQPGLVAPARFYNLWRGFSVEPVAGSHPSVDAFLEHARDNVCQGNQQLYEWLIGFFAHMVQRPFEKPLVALVFRGGKGVGKNALIHRIGHLLGSHYLLSSNRRYLVGNFNGHLENLLMFALDEAFWSGDKQAEGQLKDLITGDHHVIEHKGKEPYPVENRTRIVIIGNEDWLVPASHDERRFAVFDVGDGRKQDRGYFQGMREGMEAGGYGHLLHYLLHHAVADVNSAPTTQALIDQKHASLEPIAQWWLDCLTAGSIVSGDFEQAFGGQVDCERFREAFRRYAKGRGIGRYLSDDRSFGRVFKKICPKVTGGKRRDGATLVNTYKIPSVAEARAAWDTYIGHPVEWAD